MLTLFRREPALQMADTGMLAIDGLGKRFGKLQALQDVSLSVREGEVFAITGPSGAGKTTLARLISGLERPDAGGLTLGGRPFGTLPAQARRVAHMFESYALYPTLTVAQNVASPLAAPASAGRWTAAQQRQRVDEVLALTEIAHLRDRLPSQLSGGQKQRVALCRALAQDPSVFVLDEPIGHLDAKLRHLLRGEIRRRQSQLRPGTLWLTPDGIEAMAVSHRMAVLIGGRIQQIGTPDEVFARPANVQVARLIGDPAMNVLSVALAQGTSPSLAPDGGAPQAVSGALAQRLAPMARGGRLVLGLRPGDLALRPPGTALLEGEDSFAAQVYAVEPLGKHRIVTLSVGSQRLRAKVAADAGWQAQQPVQVVVRGERLLSFDADSGVLQG
ncbi:ABC transporter ATP-binding protein [Aquincola sp. MAHUQ-54]|uniref:ABC transporter ATP-binding protein n=1 Tax=Aquincola agrisoli TaxID=3119538 RepID=A0AAW9QID7_9BURK